MLVAQSNPIQFFKMHGLGNDFIVIDAINQHIDINQLPIKTLAHRHLGIGFDQLLLVEKSTVADVACKIFNADGSTAEQCGNGMRCVARFILEKGLSTKKTLSIETQCGIVTASVHDYDAIEVTMGVPCFEPARIPFISDKVETIYSLKTNLQTEALPITVLSMGNPHAILRVPTIDHFPVEKYGKEIAAHARFPNSTNVGFMEIINPHHIRLRTYERGVGETHACGSNACAAVVAGIHNGWLDASVDVELAYGHLYIEWSGEAHPVIMTGPAVKVFEGVI